MTEPAKHEQTPHQRLLANIGRVVREVPALDRLYLRLEQLHPKASAAERRSIATAMPQPSARALIEKLVQSWVDIPELSASGLAWALRAAEAADEARRREQTLDLVWSGPTSGFTTLRRTDQVLLQLIQEAKRSLLVVTFAAYRMEVLREAMIAAGKRGVKICMVVESQKVSEGKLSFESLDAMGAELRELATVYVWPLDQRQRNANGKYGSLHVKCAVADRERLLVSSANLTEYAFSLNMELGILVQGGELPGKVADHFEGLSESKILEPVL
jgi:phosphatidylserine/phosphatidylglycerophosphate/cardiolipin synthase-like enzyme